MPNAYFVRLKKRIQSFLKFSLIALFAVVYWISGLDEKNLFTIGFILLDGIVKWQIGGSRGRDGCRSQWW